MLTWFEEIFEEYEIRIEQEVMPMKWLRQTIYVRCKRLTNFCMKKDFEYKVNEKWLLTPFGADERVLLARAKFMLETNKLSQHSQVSIL